MVLILLGASRGILARVDDDDNSGGVSVFGSVGSDFSIGCLIVPGLIGNPSLSKDLEVSSEHSGKHSLDRSQAVKMNGLAHESLKIWV